MKAQVFSSLTNQVMDSWQLLLARFLAADLVKYPGQNEFFMSKNMRSFSDRDGLLVQMINLYQELYNKKVFIICTLGQKNS